MRKFRSWFRYGERGFTLIELLIVIAVIGVLAAVAVPRVSKFITLGNVSAAKAELSTVRTAVGAMMADKGLATIAGGAGLDFDSDLGGGEAITSYLAGGIAKLKGTYTVGPDGQVTITAYTGLTADATWATW